MTKQPKRPEKSRLITGPNPNALATVYRSHTGKMTLNYISGVEFVNTALITEMITLMTQLQEMRDYANLSITEGIDKRRRLIWNELDGQFYRVLKKLQTLWRDYSTDPTDEFIGPIAAACRHYENAIQQALLGNDSDLREIALNSPSFSSMLLGGLLTIGGVGRPSEISDIRDYVGRWLIVDTLQGLTDGQSILSLKTALLETETRRKLSTIERKVLSRLNQRSGEQLVRWAGEQRRGAEAHYQNVGKSLSDIAKPEI